MAPSEWSSIRQASYCRTGKYSMSTYNIPRTHAFLPLPSYLTSIFNFNFQPHFNFLSIRHSPIHQKLKHITASRNRLDSQLDIPIKFRVTCQTLAFKDHAESLRIVSQFQKARFNFICSIAGPQETTPTSTTTDFFSRC